ncbi:MAG: ChrR family anti-sigma-E factor [Rhizobiaceae bacterium]
MSAHRPSPETLAAFAAGRLDDGLALVVAAHIETNPGSARDFRDVEALNGALLDTIEPIAMLGGPPSLDPDEPALASPPAPARETDLPAVLAPYALGRWQSIGRGIALRRVEVPGAGARVFMLRAMPGTRLPAHRHTGAEWTAILSGAYEHEYGRYEAGDFDEAGAEHGHRPVVDPVLGCTCIVALSGKVLFDGWFGRLIQPLVRL